MSTKDEGSGLINEEGEDELEEEEEYKPLILGKTPEEEQLAMGEHQLESTRCCWRR